MTKALANKIISNNKYALFQYKIIEVLEAGIVLKGSEVKSLRCSMCNIEDSYADFDKGELILHNAYIGHYDKANRFNHQTRGSRKLLLHKNQILKLIGKIKSKGYTIVPLKIYFNVKNLVKLEIALAQGKKLHDKRQDIKEKEWQRNKQRILKGSN
jgi:SsrA-binding protein